MRKIGLLAVALTIALSGLTHAVAQGFQGRGPGPGAGPGERLERILDRLDMEAARREEILGIVDRYHQGTLGEIAREMRQRRDQLRKAIHAPDASEQQVLEAARLVSARSEQMALERHRMFMEIGRVLTVEQQVALAEMLEQAGPRRFRHHRGGPGR